MNSQITIRIDSGLAKALEQASRRLGLRRSDIVRQALRQYLAAEARSSRKVPHERVSDLIGKLASQVPDLAESHRESILDSLRGGR